MDYCTECETCVEGDTLEQNGVRVCKWCGVEVRTINEDETWR